MPEWIEERRQNAEHITYEVDAAFCREAVVVSNEAATVEPGTVVIDGSGQFVGITVNRMPKGRKGKVAATVRGPAIMILDALIFPTAVDGPDAGSDAVVETATLSTDLLAQMAARSIIARN